MSYHPFVVPVTDKQSVLRQPDYYAIPTTFEMPADFNSLRDELPEAPEGAIELDIDFETAQRQLALMLFLDEDITLWDFHENRNVFESPTGAREYLVVTDSEADDLWDLDLENYIDDCILYELPEQYRSYFDRERWKADARIDGRGHSLNRYDGSEDYVDLVDWTSIEKVSITYFIYRQN